MGRTAAMFRALPALFFHSSSQQENGISITHVMDKRSTMNRAELDALSREEIVMVLSSRAACGFAGDLSSTASMRLSEVRAGAAAPDDFA